jgi:acyl-CoA synthetase (AMP-forming)/AMP-acid ligase II
MLASKEAPVFAGRANSLPSIRRLSRCGTADEGRWTGVRAATHQHPKLETRVFQCSLVRRLPMGFIQNYDDLPMHWVGDWAGRRAALTPNRTALYDSFTQQSYTFRDMNERACRVGTYLSDVLGLRKGDVIALICRNRIEAIDIYLACGKLGIILAPLSQRLKKPELEDLLARLQPSALVYEHLFAELVASLSIPASVRSVIDVDDERNFFENVILKTDAREVNVPLAMSDICLYVHTGGTTAVPKICIVSHRQMVWNAVDILAIGLVGAYGTVLITFPFFHIGGWNTFTPLFYAGITGILMREFNPGLMLELIHAGRVENFGAVEAMLQFLIAHPKFGETDFSKLKGDHHRRRALLESGDAGLLGQRHSHQSDLWNDRGRSFQFRLYPSLRFVGRVADLFDQYRHIHVSLRCQDRRSGIPTRGGARRNGRVVSAQPA